MVIASCLLSFSFQSQHYRGRYNNNVIIKNINQNHKEITINKAQAGYPSLVTKLMKIGPEQCLPMYLININCWLNNLS